MPFWYYEKKDLRNTPSIRDGVDYETEQRYRKQGARFIMQCGTSMSLGHNTVATGVVYFHRFYMFHSFKSFPRYVTASCCLFLAGKVEETPKKCIDIIRTARTLLQDSEFRSFGRDPKEEVMTLERILLQTIKFDLEVEHPYNFLVKYAKCLKGKGTKLQKVVQMAWNFVNDSLSTTVCLQWEPEIIAVGVIHLACKLTKFDVKDSRWWEVFVAGMTSEILEDICHQILDVYQQSSPTRDPIPPQLTASKANTPSTSKPLPSLPLHKKSPSAAQTQTQINAEPADPPAMANDKSLDNQHRIPKLITTNENVHLSYGAAYGQPGYGGFSAAVPTIQQPMVHNDWYFTPNQHTQPTMLSTIHTTQQVPQRDAAATYYQQRPLPSASRNYYYGPM